MKITANNYTTLESTIQWSKIPDDIANMRNDIEDIIEFYDDDNEIKETVDLWLKELNKSLPKEKIKETIALVKSKSKFFKRYANTSQICSVTSDELISVVKHIDKELKAIPTKQQKVSDSKENIVYAHYFSNGSDWYILDDAGSGRLFCYTILNGDTQNAEFGYSSLEELTTTTGIELDFYWKKEKLGKVLYKAYPDEYEKYPKPKEKIIKKVTKVSLKTKPKKTIKKTINTDAKSTKTVDHYNVEFILIRRFYNIVSKKKKVSFRKIQLLFSAFEKAVLHRKVRKTSKKADLFDKVNKKVVKIFKSVSPGKDDAVISIANKNFYNKLESYVKNQKINYAITLLNRFINIEGTNPDFKKVKALIKSIDLAIQKNKINKTNRLYKEVLAAKKTLGNYLLKPKIKIKPKKQGLTGVKKKTNREEITIQGLKPLSQLSKRNYPTYNKLLNHPLYKFLGNLEIKNTGSIVVTNDADQGGGKTRNQFQKANMFAEAGYKVLFLSLEEHPDSRLFNDKVEEYFSYKTKKNIYVLGEIDKKTFDNLVLDFDIIFIDSWNKLLKEIKDKNNYRLDIDYDVRKKFNGKLFDMIFQRTTDGKMRGGSNAAFDGDVIIKIQKCKNWKDNYAYYDKNRYMIDNYVWNIYEQKLYLYDDYMKRFETQKK